MSAVPGPLLGDYCEACNIPTEHLAEYEVPGGHRFVFCDFCATRLEAIPTDDPHARLKANVETIVERSR